MTDQAKGKEMDFESLQGLISNELGIERAHVTADAQFRDLRADSLDMVEILIKVEDLFGVTVPDEAAANFETVGDLWRYLEPRVKAQQQPTTGDREKEAHP